MLGAINVLALVKCWTSELLKEHIKMAELLLQQWHVNLGAAFDQRFYTAKAHAHLHYAKMAIQFGSPAQHNCFHFEGFMGYLDSLTTHPPTALKQITNKLKASKQRNDLLDPMLLYELSTKEKWPDSNIYELHITNRIISDEILNFLRTQFDLAELRASKCVNFKHFLLCSRQLYRTTKDSIIFIANFGTSLRPCLLELLFSDSQTEYAVIRIFEKLEPINKNFKMPPMNFVREIDGDLDGRKENYSIVMEYDDQRTEEFNGFREMLEHRFSFRNCYEIANEDLRIGKLSLISRKEIVTKGLCLEYAPPVDKFENLIQSARTGRQNKENYCKRTYVMAMGTFEHD